MKGAAPPARPAPCDDAIAGSAATQLPRLLPLPPCRPYRSSGPGGQGSHDPAGRRPWSRSGRRPPCRGCSGRTRRHCCRGRCCRARCRRDRRYHHHRHRRYRHRYRRYRHHRRQYCRHCQYCCHSQRCRRQYRSHRRRFQRTRCPNVRPRCRLGRLRPPRLIDRCCCSRRTRPRSGRRQSSWDRGDRPLTGHRTTVRNCRRPHPPWRSKRRRHSVRERSLRPKPIEATSTWTCFPGRGPTQSTRN